MAKRGVRGWLPKNVIDEIEDIMREENLDSRSAALSSMASHAKIGRELHRLTHYSPFSNKWKKVKKR